MISKADHLGAPFVSEAEDINTGVSARTSEVQKFRGPFFSPVVQQLSSLSSIEITSFYYFTQNSKFTTAPNALLLRSRFL